MSFTPFCVTVPATTANLGPGFDTFGLALHLVNRFHVVSAAQHEVLIHPATCVDVAHVSLSPEENLFFESMAVVFEKAQTTHPPVSVSIEAHIPLARGLGSSSSVIVGGVLAANQILLSLGHKGYTHQDLVQMAHEIEGHPDNVAPALLGGAVACDVSDEDQVTTVALPWPEDWRIVVVVPSYPLLTEKARAVLPKSISMADAITNLRKASLLTASLYTEDGALFSQALDDRLHQPYRSALIPEFSLLKPLVAKAGGFGTVISGAGPTVAIFTPKNAEDAVLSVLKATKEAQQADWRILPLRPYHQTADVALKAPTA